jgi:hypothetical protein
MIVEVYGGAEGEAYHHYVRVGPVIPEDTMYLDTDDFLCCDVVRAGATCARDSTASSHVRTRLNERFRVEVMRDPVGRRAAFYDLARRAEERLVQRREHITTYNHPNVPMYNKIVVVCTQLQFGQICAELLEARFPFVSSMRAPQAPRLPSPLGPKQAHLDPASVFEPTARYIPDTPTTGGVARMDT